MVSDKKIFMGISHRQIFDEIVIGWFSSKNVSGGFGPSTKMPPQPNLA
jgi:hypothetical protein